MKPSRKRNSKLFSYIMAIPLFLALLIVSAKLVLIGFDVDEEYAFTQAFRLLKGDAPILKMWEPHQTSAFLMALLQLIYFSITGTTTGIVLFVRIMTLLLHTGVIAYFYYSLRKDFDQKLLLLLSAILFLTIPKFALIPDFTLCMYWGTLIAGVTAHKMNCSAEWRFYPALLTGFALTMTVFSYPTAIPSALYLILCLIIRSRHRMKDLFLLLTCPLVLGGSYLLRIFSNMSFEDFRVCLPMILNDGSHDYTVAEKATLQLDCLKEMIAYCIPCLLAAVILTALFIFFLFIYRFKKQRPEVPVAPISGFFRLFIPVFTITLMAKQVYVWVRELRYPAYPSLEYLILFLSAVYLFITLLGKTGRGKMYLKDLGFTFILYPFFNYFAIMSLSNQQFIVSGPFLALACAGGLLIYSTLQKYHPHKKLRYSMLYVLTLFWCAVLLFGRLYLVRTDNGMHYAITYDLQKLNEGPATGIYASKDVAFTYNGIYPEWMQQIPTEGSVFLISPGTIPYLFHDTIENNKFLIAAPSTISTPTLNENLMKYWERNPERYPDTIVWDIGFGITSNVLPALLENEYTLTYSGDYIKIFTRNCD